MKNQTRFGSYGLALAAMAIAAIVAGTVWAGQPTDGKRGSQDTPATRAVSRDTPVSRGDGTPATGRTIRRDNSTSPVKNVEAIRLAQQSQPPQPGTGNRRLDQGKDKDLGKKGDAGEKGAGTNREPVKRESTSNAGKGLPVKGSGGTKTVNPSPVGNTSAIEDVRSRLGGKKSVPPRPDRRTGLDAAKRQNAQGNAFQDRLKTGDLKQLTTGATAQKLKLAEQYSMYQKGDVARRLALEKPGNHPTVYRGVVSPTYQRQCIKYRYWGPSYFAGVCWYPTWSPWVKWSWGFNCNPYWDPRPIWCRPIVYRSCPIWVYWNTPAWRPLPVVACGTWVDLPPVEIPPADADLQLLAVRFVDPGHPEEKSGPRYRVWFRNNGSQPILQPFNVMLFAGNDQRLSAGMVQAGVRVTAIDAAAVQSVDVRLPVEAYVMGRDDQGNAAAFGVLQVLVNANREVAETTMANNGARLAPADILPVDPASFELQPKAAKPGEEILLAGEGFGPQPGRVLVQINGREMDGEILGWYDLGVRWTLPKLATAAPAQADVVVIRGDGAAANPVKIALTP